jgi:pimeloyl-ACP methyl ester carboxylesterase
LDLLAVIEECQKQYRKTGLIGFSLGAATSIITCSKTEHIDSLIVVSAPSEFEKIEFRFWELDFDLDVGYSLFQEGRIGKGVRPGPFWLPKLKPKDIVQQLKLPVYYIHGTSDWLIKPWHSEDLFKRTGSEIKKIDIMKDWPHAEYMMKTNRQIFVSKIKEWFLETL